MFASVLTVPLVMFLWTGALQNGLLTFASLFIGAMIFWAGAASEWINWHAHVEIDPAGQRVVVRNELWFLRGREFAYPLSLFCTVRNAGGRSAAYESDDAESLRELVAWKTSLQDNGCVGFRRDCYSMPRSRAISEPPTSQA
ncbi:MAG: hypothetical protein U1F52_14125 [Burkholderiales bacterium]